MKICLNCEEPYVGRGKFYCSGSCRAFHGWRIGAMKGATGKIGDKNPMWKGGRTKRNGYIFVKVGKKKYLGEHRIVMQALLGRPLTQLEEVHHRNGIKDDNRIENLDLVLKKFHYARIKCPSCKFDFMVK